MLFLTKPVFTKTDHVHFWSFPKVKFSLREPMFATNKKCTLGSEMILERKFQTLVGDNFIVEISSLLS